MHAPVKNGFPKYVEQARQLATEHAKLKDEPLLLAVYYEPERDAGDVFILEVADGFGGNAVDPERALFEVTYRPSDSFPLDAGRRIHLVLTNPAELRQAIEEKWTSAQELRHAKANGRWEVVFNSAEGDSIEREV